MEICESLRKNGVVRLEGSFGGEGGVKGRSPEGREGQGSPGRAPAGVFGVQRCLRFSEGRKIKMKIKGRWSVS